MGGAPYVHLGLGEVHPMYTLGLGEIHPGIYPGMVGEVHPGIYPGMVGRYTLLGIYPTIHPRVHHPTLPCRTGCQRSTDRGGLLEPWAQGRETPWVEGF